MGIKIAIEKELLTQAEMDTLVKLAAHGSFKPAEPALPKERAYQTTKNHSYSLYNKIEKFSSQRPSLGNVVLFVVFGRFLTEEEVRYLIESGELHSWRIDAKEEAD